MGNINSVLFQPPRPTMPIPSSRRFWIKTSLGEEIAAVFIKRQGATVTILFSHGNAEDLGTSYAWLRVLAEALNVNVLSYDYTGYGESTGSPSERNCYDDIEAAYRHLLEEREMRPEQIVLYGRSLGSGPSCYLAAKTAAAGRSVAGLILHSPFTSIYRVVVSFPFTVVGDKFPNIDLMPNIKCPVFIVHGTMDSVVPVDHGQTLYNRVAPHLRATPFWAEGLDHNDVELYARQLLLFRLNAFLDFYILARQLWVLKEPRSAPCKNATGLSRVAPSPSVSATIQPLRTENVGNQTPELSLAESELSVVETELSVVETYLQQNQRLIRSSVLSQRHCRPREERGRPRHLSLRALLAKRDHQVLTETLSN